MDLNLRTNEKTLLVELSGRLDTITSTEFLKEVKPNLTSQIPNVEIDCTGLDYISSSGLRCFMTLHKLSAEYNGTLTLLNLQAQVMEVFKMTGLYAVFNIK